MAAEPTEVLPGLVLGRYRLLERLGSGGFATVWRARDERLEREVAVKVVPLDGPADGVDPRARREALAAARVGHPGIVALYEAGEDDRALYLVSELVRGPTLAALLRAGTLSDRDVVAIGLALAGALRHAHGRGVIHRDVKPQNVIVPDQPADPAGVAKLTDFGVARLAGEEILTRTGDVVGTLAYMAPEQAEGRPAGEAADLYALGVVLYEALAGVNPARGRSPAETARRVGRPFPPLAAERRDLPRALCAAIDRAVAPAPEDRGALADLAGALAHALDDVAHDDGATIPLGPEARTRLVRAAAPPTLIQRVAALPPRAARAPALPAQAPFAQPPEGAPLDLRALRVAARRRRLLGGLGAAALAGGALALVGAGAPLHPLLIAAVAGVLVALLPRLGWLAALVALVGWVAAPPDADTGLALLLLAGGIGPVVLLWRAPAGWSVPAAAPVLGLAALGGAFPALAGQARTAWRRAALGGLGFWWLALAELAAGRTLLAGPPADAHAPGTWSGSVSGAAEHALAPLLQAPELALAAVWAVAAAVLPWLVRGRAFPLDLAGAVVWAVALGAASDAVAPGGRGTVLAAVLAAAIALIARAMSAGLARRPI